MIQKNNHDIIKVKAIYLALVLLWGLYRLAQVKKIYYFSFINLKVCEIFIT